MKKTPKKTMAQYGFGTGIQNQIFQAGSDYLLNSGIGGLNTILGGVTPQHNPMFDISEGGQIMAMGGEVNANAEVEGGEVAHLPNGQLAKFMGPSHEQGGIPTNLPEGTKIYSDRLAIDGKTMQERKLLREKQLAKLDKLTKKNPTDAFSKNTATRTKAFIDKEEQSDLMMQEMANHAYQVPQLQAEGEEDDNGSQPQYAMGTPASGIPGITSYQDWLKMINSPTYLDLSYPKTDTGYSQNFVANNLDTTERPSSSPSTPYTSGDKTGFLGNLIGAVAPLATTLANRAGDTPNINPYKNFGNKALTANSKAMDMLNRLTNRNITDINTTATGQRARNRNSASGVNTLRALDLATSAQQEDATGKVYANNESQQSQLYNSEANLDNQQDLYEAQGTAAQDSNNRRDRDSYFSNLGQNLANISSITQKTGKEMNEHQQTSDIFSLMPELNKYGLGFIHDETGKLTLTKLKN